MKISVVPRCWEEGEMMRWNTEIFRILVQLLCTMLSWWIHVMTHLFKPIEPAPRRSPHVNCGLWVTICQRRSFNDYKCSFWAGVLLVGEAVHVGEGKAYRRTLCTFPSIFLWTWNCLKDSVFLKNKGKKETKSPHKNQMRKWSRWVLQVKMEEQGLYLPSHLMTFLSLLFSIFFESSQCNKGKLQYIKCTLIRK